MKKALLVFFIFTLVFSCEMPSDQPEDPSEQPDDFNGSASTSNFVYRSIPVASSSTDFLTQANNQGSYGYIWKNDYMFSGTAYNIYVKDNTKGNNFSYLLLSTASTTSDFLTQANTQGLNGYIWKGSYSFSGVAYNSYIKDSSKNNNFSYQLLSTSSSSTDFLTQANTHGSYGYIWKGSYSFSGVAYNLYIKDSSKNNNFSYQLLSTSSSSTDFLTQANTHGSNGYIWKGSYSFSGVAYNLYIKDSSISDSYSYHVLTSQSSSSDFLTQANTEGADSYLYMNTYYFSKMQNVFFNSKNGIELLFSHLYSGL